MVKCTDLECPKHPLMIVIIIHCENLLILDCRYALIVSQNYLIVSVLLFTLSLCTLFRYIILLDVTVLLLVSITL